MTITTVEQFDVDGEALNRLGFNLRSWTGRLVAPSVNDGPIRVPYRPGALSVDSIAGPRVLTLDLWAIGADDDGIVPAGMQAQFHDNVRALQRLFWKPGLLSLTRRMQRTAGLETVTGTAKYESGLDVRMDAPGRGRLLVDLRMDDPWFYGATVQQSIAQGGPVTVNNPGDVESYKVRMDFIGALTNAELSNDTTGLTVTANTTIAGGETLVTNSWASTARVGSDHRVESMQQSSGRWWMVLARGDNDLTLTAASGSGTVDLEFDPAYL